MMEENQTISENQSNVQSESKQVEKIPFSKLECILAYIMLAVGFCFIRFVISNVTGIFTTILFGCIAFISLFYLKKNGYKLNNNHKLQFCLILIFSLLFSITANDFIKFLDVIFVLLLGVYWVYSVSIENRQIEKFFFFEMLKALFVLPFAGFDKESKAIAYSAGRSKSGNNVKLVLLGLLITIPVTMVIAMLLTSADRGVEKILNALFGNLFVDSANVVIQFVFGIPVAFYIFGMLYSNVRRLKEDVLTKEQCENKLERMKISPNIVMYSAVTPICLLYILFFVSQLQYFISAFNGILPTDYSYAEYARRGFFELFAVSLINLMILLVINFLSRQTGENKPVILKGYSVLLSTFTILIITTALSKMIMYISNYGLTPLRIYTSWFMVLLAIVFILIIIKQFNYLFCFARYAVITFVLLFGILCFSNVDGTIAKYNIKMYEAGQLNEMDIQALCNLSDDAVIYVLEQGIDTQNFLGGKLESYEADPYLTYNLSSYRVKRYFESK